MYMGGFVVECLLKALLLERHPNLQHSVDPARLSSADREVHELLFSHELDLMLDFLPEVEKKLRALSIWKKFRDVCEEWTVYARYSPKRAKIGEARGFLRTIREVKRWLREL